MERVFQRPGTPTPSEIEPTRVAWSSPYTGVTGAPSTRIRLPFNLENASAANEGRPAIGIIPGWVNHTIEPTVEGVSIHTQPQPIIPLGSGETHVWVEATMGSDPTAPSGLGVESSRIRLFTPTPEMPVPWIGWSPGQLMMTPLTRIGVVNVGTKSGESDPRILRIRNEWGSSIEFVLFYDRWIAMGAVAHIQTDFE